jgi:hypothetical protein
MNCMDKARKSFQLKGTKREEEKSCATAMQMISIKLMWEKSKRTGVRERERERESE